MGRDGPEVYACDRGREVEALKCDCFPVCVVR